jgi:hypothetical protein
MVEGNNVYGCAVLNIICCQMVSQVLRNNDNYSANSGSMFIDSVPDFGRKKKGSRGPDRYTILPDASFNVNVLSTLGIDLDVERSVLSNFLQRRPNQFSSRYCISGWIFHRGSYNRNNGNKPLIHLRRRRSAHTYITNTRAKGKEKCLSQSYMTQDQFFSPKT